MYSLHRFLVDYDMAMLRALAEMRAVTLDTNRQREAADRLADALAERDSVAAAVARLSDAGRAALDRVLAAGGRMRETLLSREFGEIRPVGPGRLEREAAWQSPANAVEELLYLGLIFLGFGQAEDEGGPGRLVIVPDDLLTLLPAPRAAVPAFAVPPVPGPADLPATRTLAEDMLALVVYVQNHDVRPYADGRLGRRDGQALLAQMGRPAERRLALVRHLAGRLGLLERQGEFLRLRPAPLKAWLTAPPPEGLALLQAAWRDDPTWIDLCHVPALVCDTAPDWLARYDPAAARRAVLGLVARCPGDEWWRLDSFVAAVRGSEPDFQRPDGDYDSWYVRPAAGGEYLSGFESWGQVEGALLADLLSGPLEWLGVLAREGEPDDLTCRVTPAGARLLGLAPAAPPVPSPPIVVHPDSSIDVPAPASFYIRFQLERFAEPESAAGACRYRLTPVALAHALSRGLRVEQILAFLHQISGRPVPPDVAGRLRAWSCRSPSRPL